MHEGFYRKKKLIDIQAIKDLLLKISQLALENPEINEIDLNPVFLFEKGLQLIDARMIL
jgi:acyl-CoA synthetase (NDP forming)